MREIKFKTYYAYGYEEEKYMRCLVECEEGERINDLFYLKQKEGVVFCQYTGVKDLNGKEIYEGDICKFSNGREEYLGVVKYLKEEQAFRLVFDDGSNTNLRLCEVVGNIFQEDKK